MHFSEGNKMAIPVLIRSLEEADKASSPLLESVYIGQRQATDSKEGRILGELAVVYYY